jgi:hypothetical protein
MLSTKVLTKVHNLYDKHIWRRGEGYCGENNKNYVYKLENNLLHVALRHIMHVPWHYSSFFRDLLIVYWPNPCLTISFCYLLSCFKHTHHTCWITYWAFMHYANWNQWTLLSMVKCESLYLLWGRLCTFKKTINLEKWL